MNLARVVIPSPGEHGSSGWPSSRRCSGCPRPRCWPLRHRAAGPTVAELARLAAEQALALEETESARSPAAPARGDEQLPLSANDRLEELTNAAPAPTVSAAVEERPRRSRSRCSLRPPERRRLGRGARARSGSPGPTSR